MKSISFKNTAFFLIVFILVAWLYKDAFSAYFFQDDWFTLKISSINSVGEFFGFFIPRTDIIYYRPLGMQVVFFTLKSLFGVNPLPFRLLTLFTHFGNTILVYLLIKEISLGKKNAYIASFLYATSSVNYTIFYWASTYPFVLGPFFFLLTFFLVVKFVKTNRLKYFFLSMPIYSAGLLVNEMLVTAPLIFHLYILLYAKFSKKEKFIKKYILPVVFYIPAFILVAFRFILYSVPTRGVYDLGIGSHVISSLKAYFIWSFNWPEEIKAQFMSFFRINPKFISDFSGYYYPLLISSISMTIILVTSVFITIRKNKKNFIKNIIFSSFWFIIGLSTVLFFPKHSFTYYLPISLIGLIFIMSEFLQTFLLFVEKFRRNLSYLVILMFFMLWMMSSVITISFNKITHWAPKRAQLSEKIIEEIKSKGLRKKPGIYYIDSSSEHKLSLNDQDGLQVYFNDLSVVTIYGEGKRDNVNN